MKKIKQIVIFALITSFIVNHMCLIMKVSAANEESAASRISNTLQDAIDCNREEPIEVMIWLDDIDTSTAVLSATNNILANTNTMLAPRSLCEVSVVDKDIYSQYMMARKEAMSECYEIYTQDFVCNSLLSEEICYYSRYAPMVIAKIDADQIFEIAKNTNVKFISEAEFAVNIEDASIVDSISDISRSYYYDSNYYTPHEIKSHLNIDLLKRYASSNLEYLNIGVIDTGYPAYYNSSEYSDQIFEHYPGYALSSLCHGDRVMDVLYSIIPEATYYYSNLDTAIEMGDGIYSEIEWLMDNDVDVITCSVPLRAQSNSSTYNNYYDSMAFYIDYIVDTYFVTFVKSVGNYSLNKNPNNYPSAGSMAYNAISVGNYNYGANVIDSGSSYYQDDEFAYKPDICAPGYVRSFYGIDSGTSYSAPIVAAVAALIIASEGFYITPVNVKAIICASTSYHRYSIVDANGIVNENYKKYGTGVIDCKNIVTILNSGDAYFGHYYADTVRMSFYLSLNLVNDYDYADLVLTFQRHTFSESIGFEIANLDIYLYDFEGEIIACSTTENNNIEVLRDIPVHDEDYTLVIEQVVPASAVDEEHFTSFSYAWCYKGEPH